MPGLPAGRMLRCAGWSAYRSAGLALIGHVFIFLFYALEGVWEGNGDRAGSRPESSVLCSRR
jgi:hypothetical protein